MQIIEVSEAGSLLDAVYADVLVPSFNPDELEPLESLRSGVEGGTSLVCAILDDAGAPVAAAAADWSPQSRVLLLSYLAVSQGLRGGGHGGALLRHVQQVWFAKFGAYVLLAEVEHPAAHVASSESGDPAARVRFYVRHGGQALDLAYFQPALDEGGDRVYGVILVAMAVEGSPTHLESGPIRRFLQEYLEATEGLGGSDPALDALWSGLDRPEGVPLLPLDQLDRIPVSTKDGPAAAKE